MSEPSKITYDCFMYGGKLLLRATQQIYGKPYHAAIVIDENKPSTIVTGAKQIELILNAVFEELSVK